MDGKQVVVKERLDILVVDDQGQPMRPAAEIAIEPRTRLLQCTDITVPQFKRELTIEHLNGQLAINRKMAERVRTKISEFEKSLAPQERRDISSD